MTLKTMSGLIQLALGLVGAVTVLLFSSPAVTWPFIAIGGFGFVSLAAHGIVDILNDFFDAELDFQVNS